MSTGGEAAAQQIDLYQRSLRPPQVALSGLASLRLLLLALAALGAWYAFGEWRISLLRNELSGLQQRADALQVQLANLDLRLDSAAPAATTSELAEQRSRLLATRQARLALLARLRRQSSAPSQPLATYFEGLVRAVPPGGTVERISIRPGSAQIAIEGQLNTPQLLPQLLQRLGHQPGYAGTHFNHAELRRDQQPGTGRLRFSLRGAAAGDQPGAAQRAP